MKEILKSFMKEKGLDFNKMIFKYEDKEIDINKNYDDFANSEEKKYSRLILYYYVRSPKSPITINFIHKKFSKYEECFLEDKIRDIVNKYCSENQMNINNLVFKHGNIPINLDNNFFYLNSKEPNKGDETSSNFSMNKNQKILEIMVIDKIKDDSKIPLKNIVIIIGIIIVIIIVTIIIITVPKKNGEKNDDLPNTTNSDESNGGGSDLKDPNDTNDDNPQGGGNDKENPSDKNNDGPNSGGNDKENPSDTNNDGPNNGGSDPGNPNDTNNDNPNSSENNPENPKETTKPSTKICQPGYFIPDGGSTASDCAKCRLKGCIDCKGTSENNECINCGGLESIYNDGKIIECKNTCEIGEEEKCSACYEDKIECKSCNIGYKLVNGKCRLDFYIKAIYQVNAPGDTIQLYNSDRKEYVSQLIIGTDIITSPKTNEYQFKNEGFQPVYIKFSKYKTGSYNSGFFKNIDKLVSVYFSDFNEYLPDLFLQSLFEGCKNLISVDISNLYGFSPVFAYNMFNGCIKLEYVNFNITYILKSTKIDYMFYNCWSLKSIDLSKLDVSEVSSFDNMFFNCTSLETINIENFSLKKDSTSINYMFKNCFSLKSLDLSSFKPYKLTSMTHAFYNCYSLTSINLNNMYTSSVTNMNYLFYNCSSLRYLDISSFNTEKVLYMSNLFTNCKSLTSIKFSNNFNTNKVTQMAALFTNCNSLKIMDCPITVKYFNLSYFFSNCHSLTSVNLENFDTIKATNFDYMFSNCYKLEFIAKSNFNFQGTIRMVNMFSGCYSLTSINFPISNSVYANFNQIFFDCPNLKFVNFSFVKNTNSDYHLFNENISDTGTIILKNNLCYSSYTKYVPPNWNVTLLN